MNDEKDQAFADAEAAATAGIGRLLENLADRLGANTGAKAVFGKPVEKNGRTVIPVAQAMLGTGGGSGGSQETGAGSGAGGGAMTRPLGYIEMDEHHTMYVPLQQPWQDPRLILAVAFGIWLVLRAISKLIRG